MMSKQLPTPHFSTAEIVVRKQVSSINARNDKDAINTWLGEFIDSKNTLISYTQAAERFYGWLRYHGKVLHEVSRDVIQYYQRFLQNPQPFEIWCGPAVAKRFPDGSPNPNWRPFVRGLSTQSINLNLSILKAMFDYLVASGYLERNPFRLIRKTSANEVKDQPIERFLTAAEFKEILLGYIERMPRTTELEIREYYRSKWLFVLLYLTGCRRSEIINAKMSDFVFKRNQWWLKVIGKGNKYGEIPVTNELFSALIEYRQANNLDSYPNQTEKDIALIFNLRNRTSITDDSVLYKIIKKICNNIADELRNTDPAKAFKFEKVSTHWLRHSSATAQVDAGIDIRIVKKNLRHSQLETTMKYQHTESSNQHKETTNKFKIDDDENYKG